MSKVQEKSLSGSDLSYLEGEILTIIEAVIPHEPYMQMSGTPTGVGWQTRENSQIDSIKSLIKAAFSRQLSKLGIGRK